MEDKERIEGTEEDVEGHRGKRKVPMQSEEQADETEGEEDDVEGHAMRHRPSSL
jgi:hypothetical protein